MGLDIVLFDHSSTIGFIEISEQLHNAIFNDSKTWRSYLHLRKISDYYKADVILNGNELKMFIHDLESVSIHIEQKFHGGIVRLISTLKQDKVKKVHIAGD